MEKCIWIQCSLLLVWRGLPLFPPELAWKTMKVGVHIKSGNTDRMATSQFWYVAKTQKTVASKIALQVPRRTVALS